MLHIMTLMDDKPSENKALRNEHGLSYWVNIDGHCLLFDCGAGDATWKNAHRLGVALEQAEAVVLSHSHYDHAAGYRDLAEAGFGKKLYTGEHFFEKKYAFDGVRYTDLSAGFDEDFLRAHGVSHQVCKEIEEILPNVWAVSHFERTHPFETVPGRFVKKIRAEVKKDEFSDETALAVKTGKGLVVLVGCSHPGILNMISTIHERLKEPVYAVFGGTHLVEADEERITKTIESLWHMGLRILGLSHCSGDLAECRIGDYDQVKSCHMAAGDCVFFE